VSWDVRPRDICVRDEGPYRHWTYRDQFGAVWQDVQFCGDTPPQGRRHEPIPLTVDGPEPQP
jgi:hypothetical protein